MVGGGQGGGQPHPPLLSTLIGRGADGVGSASNLPLPWPPFIQPTSLREKEAVDVVHQTATALGLAQCTPLNRAHNRLSLCHCARRATTVVILEL